MTSKPIRVSTDAPSIVVIQGAYRLLSAEEETEYHSGNLSGGRIIGSFSGHTIFVEDIRNRVKFQNLVARWRKDRGATSSITEAAFHPAYQGIIGMGEVAVPFILAQLQSEGDEPDQWFWALKAITGADPVDEKDRGDYLAMALTWLNWANSEGYDW